MIEDPHARRHRPGSLVRPERAHPGPACAGPSIVILIDPMPIPPDEPLRVVGDPLFRVVGDEVFILTPDSQMHWLKNATARHLWELLVAAGPSGIAANALADALAAEFEVEPTAAVGDVLAFLDALAGRGLVAPVPA